MEKDDEPSKKGPAKRWAKVGTAAFALVLAPILVGLALYVVPRLIERYGPQVNVTARVTADTSCNFVLPLEGDLEDDPTQLAVSPGSMGTMPCDDAISELNGVHRDLTLEAVITPEGDEAVVLTDVTIEVREQVRNSGSGYYSTGGIGGQSTTMTVLANVEAMDSVQEVHVHGQDGSFNRYESVREIPARPNATKSDPLVVNLSLYGEQAYTTFDIILHWQKGTSTGTSRLDNGGPGYQVAGIEGLRNFRRGANDVWEPGSN